MAGYRKGEFTPDELDLAILRALPAHGSKIGKYLDDGVPVKALPGLVEGAYTTSAYAGRVRSMEFAGLVRKTKGLSSEDTRYQRTADGDKLVSPVRKVADA